MGRHLRLSCRFPPCPPQQGLLNRSGDACAVLKMKKELSTGDEDRAETVHAFLANWGAGRRSRAGCRRNCELSQADDILRLLLCHNT